MSSFPQGSVPRVTEILVDGKEYPAERCSNGYQWESLGLPLSKMSAAPHVIQICGRITISDFDDLWFHFLRFNPPEILDLQKNRLGDRFTCTPGFLEMILSPRIKFVDLRWNDFDNNKVRTINFEITGRHREWSDCSAESELKYLQVIRKLVFVPDYKLCDMMRYLDPTVIAAHRKFYGWTDTDSSEELSGDEM
jgi:hypothetical protein